MPLLTKINPPKDTALRKAAENPETFAAAIAKIDRKNLLKHLTKDSECGDTALHIAATHPATLKIALKALSRTDECEKALLTPNGAGVTAMAIAAESEATVTMALNAIAPPKRKDALLYVNKFNNYIARPVEIAMQASPDDMAVLIAALQTVPTIEDRKTVLQQRSFWNYEGAVHSTSSIADLLSYDKKCLLQKVVNTTLNPASCPENLSKPQNETVTESSRSTFRWLTALTSTSGKSASHRR